MSARVALVLSCEHATNRVPRGLERLFRGRRALLASHEAFDAGALALARALAERTGAPLEAGRATRLAIDLNRSLHHPRLLGRLLRELPRDERDAWRARLVDEHWRPFRSALEHHVERALARRDARVLHVSVHSFTPRLDGVTRPMDLALLYDPARPLERAFATWAAIELAERTGAVVARNRPYRGTSDGHTTALRHRFGADAYAGVEVELNQRWLRAGHFPAPFAAAIAAVVDPAAARVWLPSGRPRRHGV